MDHHTSALERAFELARSGCCKTTAEIRMALKSEGYSDLQMEGKSLSMQLKTLIEEKAESRLKAR